MNTLSAILDVAPADRVPIYRQIELKTTEAIADGRLRTGDCLSPWQDVAEVLAVSPLAVKKAYQGLERRGLCREEQDGRYRVIRGEKSAGKNDKAKAELPFDRGELELARDIQCRLLPPRSVTGQGFQVAARSVPASFVGGDFYDVLHHGDGSVGVVVGDVAGKGLGASLIMASVKATLPFVAEGKSVEDTLSVLGRRLHGELGPRDFVSLAYARLDVDTGLARVSVAGLPDPVVLRPGEKPQELAVPQPRLPLGVRPDVEYRATELVLRPGDRLLLYSDGIPESRTETGHLLGYEGLASVLSAWQLDGSQLALGRWIDGLISRLHEASGRDPLSMEPLQDDWTAVALESLSCNDSN